jgi:hypothetical protein
MADQRREDMADSKYSPAEIGRIGREIYQRELRPKVEHENVGRFIAIDIRNGCYEIDDDEMKVVERYLAREPAGELLVLRIGYNATHALGGRLRKVV